MSTPTPRPVSDAPNLASLNHGPTRLYAGALRHLTGRAAISAAYTCLRIAHWAAGSQRTARNRAVVPEQPPSAASGRADLQLVHLAPDHGWFACGGQCPAHYRPWKDMP